MRIKQTVSVVLVLALLCVCRVPLAARDDHNAVVEERVAELEQKYDIRIRYDTDDQGDAAIDKATLNMLDKSLGYVTPAIVRQVSAHYREKTGKRLTYSFEYTPFQSEEYGIEVVGVFAEADARIRIFIPSSSAGTYVTGAAPITIVHEFAHALHRMCGDVLGADVIQRQWTALNGSAAYSRNYLLADFNRTVFVSSYGATSYGEDFAEVFAHAFVRNQAGQGFSNRLALGGNYTSLGYKVLVIEALLESVFSDTEAAAANLRRAFSTSPVMEYQGLRLSGEELQFMGFSAPRYVRKGIERARGIEEASSEWIRDIGGWLVEDTAGRLYLLFPGGYVSPLTRRSRAAA